MKLWAGRFQKETNILVNDFNSSIGFDARLYEQDIRGSIAHASMLGNHKGHGLLHIMGNQQHSIKRNFIRNIYAHPINPA